MRAVGRMFIALVTHRPLFVTPERAVKRQNICAAQDGGCFDAAYDQCRVCTCHVSIKTLFATERCPRGKWGREPVDNTL